MIGKLVFAAAVATAGAGVLADDWQVPVDYRSMVIDCSTPNLIYVAFNNTFLDNIAGCDASSWAYVDLGAKFNLTRILYGGRYGDVFTNRMRSGKFIVSENKTTWTVITNVPGDFVQQQQPNATNILDLTALGLKKYRYVGWKDIGNGSINEVQWWTDTRAVIPFTPSFENADATGVTMNFKMKRIGDYDEDALVNVKVYKSAVDHGSDIADWNAAEDLEIEDLGDFDVGVDYSKRVLGIAVGDTTSLRLLMTCDGTESFSDDGWSFDVDRNPIAYTEWRPLTNSALAVPDGWRSWNADHQWRLFDNDETTAGLQPISVVDYGRPVRVDRVRLVTSGAAGWPVQGSMDSWGWTTITNRLNSDPLAVSLKLPEPQVYRYFRMYYEPSPGSPQVSEIRLYTVSNAPYVAVNDESVVSYRKSGITLSGTVFAGGTNEISSVTLRAWVGDQDYGPDAARWSAAGVTPVDLGEFSVGENYTVGPIAGTAGRVQYVRIQAVSSVDGCANGLGAAHAFTMADEYELDVAYDGVVAMMNGAWSRNLAEWMLQSVHNFCLCHDMNIDNKSDQNPWGAVLPKRVKVTRIAWYPRFNASCNARSRSAKYYFSDAEVAPVDNDSSWTQVGTGASPNPGWCNQWNQIYVGCKARHFMQKGDTYGNERVRIWAENIPGLTIIVK